MPCHPAIVDLPLVCFFSCLLVLSYSPKFVEIDRDEASRKNKRPATIPGNLVSGNNAMRIARDPILDVILTLGSTKITGGDAVLAIRGSFQHQLRISWASTGHGDRCQPTWLSHSQAYHTLLRGRRAADTRQSTAALVRTWQHAEGGREGRMWCATLLATVRPHAPC